jgi:hypothetical protein
VEGSRRVGEEGGEKEWGKGGGGEEEVDGLGKGCPVRFYPGKSRVLC